MTSVHRAARRAIHIHPTEKVPHAYIARTEASMAGTAGTDKSAPHPPKRARIPCGKVGGHAHKEGDPHPSARRFPLPWQWGPATLVRQSWPVLCARDADCHDHRTWLREGRGNDGRGEGRKERRGRVARHSQVSRIAKVAPAIPDAQCAKEFGGEFRRRYCGGKKRVSRRSEEGE
ncbi:hypothetical protein B0H13DRAFT_1961235 [Mycena leptocephala]|nr:hypothetical protein B0H13DRAFT_1961235 [Mycena leptocephala]